VRVVALNMRRLLFRAWYYFRIGYGTYLTFLLGFATTIVTVYYLAINNISFLKVIFPSFWLFSIIFLVVGVPLSIFMGLFHLKRSIAYVSETDIGVEANPWYYKYPPGYTREAWGPLFAELLKYNTRLLEANNLLSDEDKARIRILEEKLKALNQGGTIGWTKNT
jgi:hypothetical protein